MTQIELPQVQVGRYLDLLKRRRWHLVPAALLGLAVGTMVAFLIPRYYVAETIVRILPRTVDTGMSRQDRFLEEIRKARVVIKNEGLIAEAIRELEWIGASEPEDTDSLRERLAEIADRIEVSQMEAGEAATSSALLSIQYRDRDGVRAAKFLNKLRDLYLDREFSAILRAEKRRLEELTNKEARHTKALDRAFDDRREILRRSGINEGYRMTPGGQFQEQDERLKEFRQVEADIASLSAEIEGFQEKLRIRRATLATMDPKKIVNPDQDPRVRDALRGYNDPIRRLRQQLATMSEGDPIYKALNNELRGYIERRDEIIEQMKAKGFLNEINPRYQALQQEIDELAADLVGKKKQLEARQERFKVLDQFRRDLPDYRTALLKISAKLDEERRLLQQVHDRQEEQSDKVAAIELNRTEVVDVLRPAYTPPEPNYPNKYLIAFLGAILGLGSAVGFIFFIDVAQSTFKSYDDVGRALSIPVLGGVSYLELEEDLKESKRKRFRVGAFTLFVILLIASVLVIYVVWPVRLPSWLRDFFDMVFQRQQ